jgi:hypothetical protein
MGPGDVFALLIVVLIPTLMVIYMAKRFFAYREKQLEIEALNAAEKAAQYASRSSELEERVRVLEQIVTDGGAQTAAQIEALRKPIGNRKRAVAKNGPA